MKDGQTHLAHKAEHAIDMETGAIVAVTVQRADQGDTTTLKETLIRAAENIEEATGQAKEVAEVACDKGYHSTGTVKDSAALQIRSYSSEPKRGGRKGKGNLEGREATCANRSRIRAERGSELLRRRGEKLERAFAHLFRSGGMRRTNILVRFIVVGFVFACCLTGIGTAEEKRPIRFRKHQLDARFRSEGVAVGDFNRDGEMDLAAGFVWYEAPDWKPHAIVKTPPSASRDAEPGVPLHYHPEGYSNAFANFAEDVNGDGWTDVICVDFPGTPTWWFENPRGSEGEWKKHLCTPVTNNESPGFLDLDGDGRRELIAGFSPDPEQSDGPDRHMAFIKPDADPHQEWHRYPISSKAAPGTNRYSHGLGVGDVNKDGRNDIVVAAGWWEAPESRSDSPWKFHEAALGERGDAENRAAQMYVYDFDGDGDNDVLSSSPHAFGIWWHEQFPGNRWKTHEIDKSFSQTHALCLADINGDGLVDFVTGKRWWAHLGKDPGSHQPAVLFWFELQRKDGRPRWIRHQLDRDSGVGTQFEVADVNGDRLLDIVSSNKKGVYYFEQIRE